MARSHARVKTSIHRDPDWLERSPEARWTYVALLSDPKLTIAGVMELAEKRWTRTTGYDMPTLIAALVELEEHAYVVVDSDTDELLIRTLAKHDLDPGRLNKNIGKGYWGAWGMVESPILRSVIVHELDDALWAGLVGLAPPDAVENRRSARLEPQSHFRSEPETAAPVATYSTSHQSPVTSRQPESRPCDPAAERRARLEAAAAVIGERAAARNGVEDSEAVRRSVKAAVVRDRYQDAYAIITDHPDLSADELAERLEPSSGTSTTRVGAVVLGHDPRGAPMLPGYQPLQRDFEPFDTDGALEAISAMREQYPLLSKRTNGATA